MKKASEIKTASAVALEQKGIHHGQRPRIRNGSCSTISAMSATWTWDERLFHRQRRPRRIAWSDHGSVAGMGKKVAHSSVSRSFVKDPRFPAMRNIRSGEKAHAFAADIHHFVIGSARGGRSASRSGKRRRPAGHARPAPERCRQPFIHRTHRRTRHTQGNPAVLPAP